MTADDTSTRPTRTRSDKPEPRALALAIAWLAADPGRVGEQAILEPGTAAVFGRGPARPDDPAPRLAFCRRGETNATPLAAATISRVQLRIRAEPEFLVVERVGQAPMTIGGRAVERATLVEGDVLVLGDEIALFCVSPSPPPSTRPAFAFGASDPHGLVGESRRLWALRDELRFYAARADHVVLHGPSGVGKELCARAIHRLSARANGPFLARSAATLPAGIVDAELFGNARNFPNAGMRERAGLVAEADRGTLFLDEIGELPESLQAHLLRVLDAGEFHRLGEDRSRVSDLRLVAATNRSLESLKHDLLARFKLRLTVPGLDERREDVPLLIRHLLRATAERDHELAARYFAAGEPRVEAPLVAALLEHSYTTHVRELESLLLASMATSPGERLTLTRAVAERLRRREPEERAAPVDERESIERALAAAGGNVSIAWKVLGVSSRDALNRLIKKHGIVVRRD